MKALQLQEYLFCGLIIKDFIEKDDKKFLKYLIISSVMVMAYFSFYAAKADCYRNTTKCILDLSRKGVKAASLAVVITLVVHSFFQPH
jgi:hypothetical protein